MSYGRRPLWGQLSLTPAAACKWELAHIERLPRHDSDLHAIRATIGTSSAAGGLSFINCAIRVKYAARSSAFHLGSHRCFSLSMFRIDRAGCRCVRHAVGAQRDFSLILSCNACTAVSPVGVPVQ